MPSFMETCKYKWTLSPVDTYYHFLDSKVRMSKEFIYDIWRYNKIHPDYLISLAEPYLEYLGTNEEIDFSIAIENYLTLHKDPLTTTRITLYKIKRFQPSADHNFLADFWFEAPSLGSVDACKFDAMFALTGFL